MRISTAGFLSATAILAVAVAGPAHAGPAVIEVCPGRFARLIPGIAEQLHREGPRQAAILHDP